MGAQSVVQGLNAVTVGTRLSLHFGLEGGTVTVAVAVGISQMVSGQKSVKGLHLGCMTVVVER